MTAKQARVHDDGLDDPDNPIVPFRMSDRVLMNTVQLKVNVIMGVSLFLAGLIAAGMVLRLY